MVQDAGGFGQPETPGTRPAQAAKRLPQRRRSAPAL